VGKEGSPHRGAKKDELALRRKEDGTKKKSRKKKKALPGTGKGGTLLTVKAHTWVKRGTLSQSTSEGKSKTSGIWMLKKGRTSLARTLKPRGYI